LPLQFGIHSREDTGGTKLERNAKEAERGKRGKRAGAKKIVCVRHSRVRKITPGREEFCWTMGGGVGSIKDRQGRTQDAAYLVARSPIER